MAVSSGASRLETTGRKKPRKEKFKDKKSSWCWYVPNLGICDVMNARAK
jgi:hypothetical protein